MKFKSITIFLVRKRVLDGARFSFCLVEKIESSFFLYHFFIPYSSIYTWKITKKLGFLRQAFLVIFTNPNFDQQGSHVSDECCDPFLLYF